VIHTCRAEYGKGLRKKKRRPASRGADAAL